MNFVFEQVFHMLIIILCCLVSRKFHSVHFRYLPTIVRQLLCVHLIPPSFLQYLPWFPQFICDWPSLLFRLEPFSFCFLLVLNLSYFSSYWYSIGPKLPDSKCVLITDEVPLVSGPSCLLLRHSLKAWRWTCIESSYQHQVLQELAWNLLKCRFFPSWLIDAVYGWLY